MEETEYNRVADRTEEFVEVMLNASEAIAQLQVRPVQIAKRKERKDGLNLHEDVFQSEWPIQSSSSLLGPGQLVLKG